MHGKTIQIFLPNGNPKSLRVADVTGRTYRITAIPRNELTEAKKRSELQQVGIYFLLGSFAEMEKAPIYIGAAEALGIRLLQHNKKDFWNTALVVTSKDFAFTKAHANYLEWYCLQRAYEAGRYEVSNIVKPNKPHLPEAPLADMEECYEIIAILTAALGYPIFEKLESDDRKTDIFCETREASARGRYFEDGLIVYEGSTVWPKNSATLGRKDILKRSLHLEQGDLVPHKGVLKLKRSLIFPTPSEASNFVLGRKSNGWILWKYKNGKTLDEIVRKIEQ